MPFDHAARLAVVIPAYKPSTGLVDVVRTLSQKGLPAIVIVDDGSGPDFQETFSAERRDSHSWESAGRELGRGRHAGPEARGSLRPRRDSHREKPVSPPAKREMTSLPGMIPDAERVD